ncbi:unnamed protein product [Heterobilharzia americana]|nr:unnamed protein product [Heterobilharzia americana]
MPAFPKVILCAGTQKPYEHDRVIVDVSIIVDSEPRIQNQRVTFDLGHGDDFGVIKLVDDIVKDMGCGEQCEVALTSDHVFTNLEKEFLGISDARTHDVSFNIHLQDIQKLAEFWQMSENEKYVVADVMKRRGNKLLKTGSITRAFNCYKKAIKILDGSVSVVNPGYRFDSMALDRQSPELSPSALLAVCLSNAAHCLFKLGTTYTLNLTKPQSDYLLLCIKCCKRAIELQPDYVKVWFRKAKAHAALGNYEEAVRAGQKCLSCLEDDSSCRPKWMGVDECTSTNTYKRMQIFLSEWRASLANEQKTERSIIRKRTVHKYSMYGDWCYDDMDEIEKIPISVWSNDLAENMMSLHEELEAFGEKMPEFKACRTKGKSRLATIQDEDTDGDGCQDNDV